MNVETVVKVGGSLSSDSNLRALMNTLATLATEYGILIVPGGGGFADGVRYYYRKYQLNEAIAHHMAILAMDQFGFLLHGLTPNSLPVRTLSEARQTLDLKRLPVLLPSTLLFTLDPLPHSWNVTSDSLSAYITKMIEAQMLVILKDVDGIFSSDPHQSEVNTGKFTTPLLLRSVPVTELNHFKCVDSHFPKALEGGPECWILNGTRPERLTQLFKQGQTIGTQVRF
jgi:hypothetical protein